MGRDGGAIVLSHNRLVKKKGPKLGDNYSVCKKILK